MPEENEFFNRWKCSNSTILQYYQSPALRILDLFTLFQRQGFPKGTLYWPSEGFDFTRQSYPLFGCPSLQHGAVNRIVGYDVLVQQTGLPNIYFFVQIFTRKELPYFWVFPISGQKPIMDTLWWTFTVCYWTWPLFNSWFASIYHKKMVVFSILFFVCLPEGMWKNIPFLCIIIHWRLSPGYHSVIQKYIMVSFCPHEINCFGVSTMFFFVWVAIIVIFNINIYIYT